eukprot:729146-Prymnesium_polylepis.1
MPASNSWNSASEAPSSRIGNSIVRVAFACPCVSWLLFVCVFEAFWKLLRMFRVKSVVGQFPGRFRLQTQLHFPWSKTVAVCRHVASELDQPHAAHSAPFPQFAL